MILADKLRLRRAIMAAIRGVELAEANRYHISLCKARFAALAELLAELTEADEPVFVPVPQEEVA